MILRSARSWVANRPPAIDTSSTPQAQSPRGTTLRRSLTVGLAVLAIAMTGGSLPAQQAPEPDPQPAYPQDSYPQQQPTYGVQQAEPGYPQTAPEYGQNSTLPDRSEYEAPPPPDPPYGYAPAAQQPQALSPDQLEQLVAPIALYPDALLAQVLAASTYPNQVADAAQWRQAQMGAPPQQIADEANDQPWDPSVKALTAFPQVLAEMDENLQWTTELGNAYYNQPQDVFAAVQDLRQRAEAAGTLQNTPQEIVSDNQGYIQLAPANPQIVYVPGYNPWSVYGAPIAPYPGFSLLSSLSSFVGPAMHFGMGMVMTAFMPMSWGWLGWGLNWLGHLLTFDNAGYYSHSPTLVDWGLPYGGPRAWRNGYGRGYETARSANGYGWRSNPNARFDSMGSRYENQRVRQQNLAEYARRDAYSDRFGRSDDGVTRMPAFNARPQYSARALAQHDRPARYNSAWNDRGRQNWNGGARQNESWARTQMSSRGYDGSQRYAMRNDRAYAQAPRSAFGESEFRSSAYGRSSFGGSSAFRSSGYGRHDFSVRSSRGFSRSSGKSWKPAKFRGFAGGHASRSFRGGGHFKAPKMSHGGHGGGHGGRHRW